MMEGVKGKKGKYGMKASILLGSFNNPADFYKLVKGPISSAVLWKEL